MKRRHFLTSFPAAAGLSAVSAQAKATSKPESSDRWGEILPTRILGRTGVPVTLLGVGGFHVGWTEERNAAEVIETAMEGGIRFFDTAESYQKGESERRYGKYLVPKYREEIFIMTKTQAGDAKTAQEHLDGSMKRMGVDVIDLWQIHTIRNPEDVDSRLANGVLDVLIKAKEQGKVRYIGFTGHTNPEAHLRMLQQTCTADPFDTCQMPVNAIDPQAHSFVNQVTPVLQDRNIALLAMKTLADGRFFALKRRLDRIQWQTENPIIPTSLSIRDALAYAWSQPCATLVTGAENASLLREKIDLAKAFAPLTPAQLIEIQKKMSAFPSDKVEYYKRPVTT